MSDDEIMQAIDLLLIDYNAPKHSSWSLRDYLREFAFVLVAAQRERLTMCVSAAICSECAAGDIPSYDSHWRSWYHDNTLCLGYKVRNAMQDLV